MVRKKVVLFIVEGITDKESLELLLTELNNGNEQLIFELTEGDITSESLTDVTNIKNKITDIIKGGGKRKFKPMDYKEVIHIVDMDGVYISKDKMHCNSSLIDFSYKEDCIYANSIEKIMNRNRKKQDILNLLCSTKKVYKSVPYRIFYFSANLEHVLHNIIEVEDSLKMKYAEEFQEKYIGNIEGFVKFICESDFTVKKDYKNSWDFIKKNNNSIRRFTNFNIVIDDYSNVGY